MKELLGFEFLWLSVMKDFVTGVMPETISYTGFVTFAASWSQHFVWIQYDFAGIVISLLPGLFSG